MQAFQSHQSFPEPKHVVFVPKGNQGNVGNLVCQDDAVSVARLHTSSVERMNGISWMTSHE